MANYVDYVILRMVGSDHDDPVQDYREYNADPRVIYQIGNEANVTPDSAHWIGQMKAADAHGRKVVIFNDSVGATSDEMWKERIPALLYAFAHGHYVGLHAYGNVSDGQYHPMTAWDSPPAWRWFAGRYEHLYDPANGFPRPKLILSECGAGGFQRSGGLDNWLRDVREMDRRAQLLPELMSFNFWSAGGKGPDKWPGDPDGMLGFGRDTLDDWLLYLL